VPRVKSAGGADKEENTVTLHIREATAREVKKLTDESTAVMAALYPDESNHLIDPVELASGKNLLLGAFVNGEAVGCVGVLRHSEEAAEIKRLFVLESYRGQGFAKALMRHAEHRALREGIAVLRLETGSLQPEPVALYESLGYKRRGPFGHYHEDPLSVFFEKILDPLTVVK
jgi:putative acetyltransferase